MRDSIQDPPEAVEDTGRLDALRRTGLLDTAADPAFDRLTRLATQRTGAPIALVSLVDAERQFFKSCIGLPEPWASRRETPLSHSFCKHAVASREPLIIEDARTHPLVRDNLAIADLGVVAYAGIPLLTPEGQALGTVCVIDTQPRAWSPEEIEALRELAGATMDEIERVRAAAPAGAAPPAAAGAGAPGPDIEVVTFDDAPAAETAKLAAASNAWVLRAGAEPLACDVSAVEQLLAEEGSVVWIDLMGDSAQLLHALGRVLRLHPAFVRLALPPWERPRLETFRDYALITTSLLVSTRSAEHGLALRVSPLALFVGRNYVVSIHTSSLPFFNSLVMRVHQGQELLGQLRPAHLLTFALGELLEHFAGLIEGVETEIELIEERALRDTSDDFLADLLGLKRYVFALGRYVDQHQPVFSGLTRPDLPLADKSAVAPYLAGLQSRLDHEVARLLAQREAVNGAFNIYVSHVSHLTNRVMKALTIISTMLLPGGVIFGLYGTNFPDLPIFQPAGLVVMIAGFVAVPAVIFYVLRRLRLI